MTPPPQTPPPPAARRPSDILLIDDDPTVRVVLEKALQRSGYAVDTALDGKTAVGLLTRNRFRLVITDIYMPNMDGYEVIMQINATKPKPLVLAISGGAHSSAASSLKTAKLLGSSRLLAKPFDLSEFSAVVHELIGPPAAN